MTPNHPRVSAIPSTRRPLRGPDGAAGGDFVWPPPADDPATCSIVLLEPETGHDARPQTTVLADEPAEAFPDVDVESALDEFADPPAAPKIPPTARPTLAYSRQTPQPTAFAWWIAAWRSIVALCIGASLGLTLSAGLPFDDDARPLPVPPKAEPRVATSPEIGMRDRLVAPRPLSQPRPGNDVPRDEDRIRTTLAQLRTAYARLDAGAAREVWPSVDEAALARAFDGLKSQELRFDHCEVTVEGARARAACTGEAVYVPRTGAPRSSSAARAWTFELTRLRERWMIASGRAS
jgi:hypothetical protein